MTKVPVDQRSLFETEQEHIDRVAQATAMLAAPEKPAQWFPGIENDQYNAVVARTEKIKARIKVLHGMCWDEENDGDWELRHDLNKLWQDYGLQIGILESYNLRGICNLADKAEQEIQKLVTRMNMLDDEGEDVRELLRRYELLFDQCIMLGGQPY